ncbi:aryldialkylphosphatase [Microbacterium testaceum]|uniref:phosphotriesterase family protein n=1 Tax=Microbacterium testaceum TaxID=2033 RepID=UPI0007344B9B|nr:aryldialkylphosphatase [Microbacterium testaceum]KTS85992.1 aryldialkylphosphatase [Microbacterium testaceum]
MSYVTTVLGRVPAEELGRVMPHEHLLSLDPGPWATGGGIDTAIDTAIDRAVEAIGALPVLGFQTIVDLSPYNVVGRDEVGDNVAMLAEISRRSGMHIVSGTALYLESYAPSWAKDATLDELHDRLVRDATEGIGASGVRAGVFGEQATSLDEITPHEEKCLRAVARAQRETGLSIMTHTTHGTMALAQLELLREEGVDLERVVVGHLDTQLDRDLPRRVIDAGARIAVDTIGKQDWDFFLGPQTERAEGEYVKRAFHRSDVGRADLVAELVAEGLADRLLLAQDLTGAELWMNPGTHGTLGYSYLGSVFVPMLRERGVSESSIEQMLATNPAAVLSVSEAST